MKSFSEVRVTECPRDAMQGLAGFVPTELKVRYLNALLKVGFNRLDFGSFVSPKAIPQMRDTSQVLELLDHDSSTELIAIVANLRGAQEACSQKRIDFLGYPFSISETFQIRNTNMNVEGATNELLKIQEISDAQSKRVIVYLSMAFGNPYGDPYHPEMVMEQMVHLKSLGFEHFALADTVGIATAEDVSHLVSLVSNSFQGIDFGVHLHCKPVNWQPKLAAAYQAGCSNFDVAIGGYGGCPMAADALVGNLSTEWLVQYFESIHVNLNINLTALAEAQALSRQIFSNEQLMA